jgi:hypothetical protein
MVKKLICFSLWGSHEFYNYGALENALIAKDLYVGWTCRFYYLDNCDKKIIEELGKLDNVELVKMSGGNSNGNMFWRFDPAFNGDGGEDVIFLSRDSDSRLSIKEKLAVDEWLASDKDFHIMRDNPQHTTEILGGMWGCRNGILKPFQEFFNKFIRTDQHGLDQQFLKHLIYPYVINKSMVHASYYKLESFAKDFPTVSTTASNAGGDFIGSYVRTAPLTFKVLGQSDRLLEVMFPHQALKY